VEKQHSWKGLLGALITLWILISPWVLVHFTMEPLGGLALANFFAVGIIMMVISIVPLTTSISWERWIHPAIGIWLIASPWILRFEDNAALTWNAVVTGALVLGLSGWGGTAKQHKPGTM
jgi:hypothetical protein